MMKLEPISKSEAARYMGVKGEPDAKTAHILDEAERFVRETLRPKYIFRETSVTQTDEVLRLDGVTSVLTGNDIKKHLSGCTRAVILAATLSADADKLIRQAAVTDMVRSLAIDCLCSAAVEQVCDRAEEEIFSRIDAPYRTWRFSPGYGDLPVELQSDLLIALNAQRSIGLTVSESSLLIPSKSVTAIIGISDKPVRHGSKGCESCSMRESCAFRRSGGCGKVD